MEEWDLFIHFRHLALACWLFWSENTFHLQTLCVVLQVLQLVTTEPYCTSGTSQSNPDDPPLPDMPPSFQTRLEANLIDRGYTMEAAEYADSDGNRGALTVISNGDLDIMIYDYNTGQIYSIHDNVCTTKAMSNDTVDDYLYGDIRVRGSAHIYSTNDIIKFAQRFGEKYMGQKFVRGVWCDHWQSCMYWGYFKANFTLDYYFTALNWTTSMTYPQVPVRADVTGIMQTSSGSRNFHHIYDYYDFRPGIEPGTSVFETPPNVICPNRKSVKLIPKIENQFYFRSEQTEMETGKSVNMQIWYDNKYNVVRADFGSHTPAIYIEDYNRGIRYIIDKQHDTCTMGPIPIKTYSGQKVGKSNRWVLELLTPKEFLRLQENFVYVGQRSVRGIKCDLFVAGVTGDRTSWFTNAPADNITVEAYFSRVSEDETPDTGTPGDVEDYSHVLVQMIVYINETVFENVVSFYDFDFTHPNPETTFDLTSCYSDRQKMGFRIKFPVEAAPTYVKYNMDFKQKTLAQLTVVLNLEPTRIQHLDVHADDDNVYVTGQLLERPPLLAGYYKIPDQSIEVVEGQYDNITSAEDCAKLCDSDTECVSFSICSTLNMCYISHVVQQYDPDYDTPLTVPNCVRYSAVVKRLNDLPDHDMTTAWTDLRNMVFTKELVLTLDLPLLPNLVMNVTATEVIEDDIWKHGNTEFLQSIQLYGIGASLVSPSSTLEGVAFDDCARHCVGDQDCHAFSYCTDTTECQMLTDPVSDNDLQYDPSQFKSCFVYNVTSSTSSPATSTSATVPPQTTVVPSSTTSLSTAQVKSTTSKGSSNPTPAMKTSPTQPSPATPRNTEFFMYEHNADFMNLVHTKIAISVEECLEYCIQEPQCQTITICERQKKCHLSNLQPDSTYASLVQPHLGCDVYTLSAKGLSPVTVPTTQIVTHNMSAPSYSHPVSTSSTPFSASGSVSTICPSTSPNTGSQIPGYTLAAWSTLPGIAKVARQIVPSANKCGQYCDARTDFDCKAIQYCPGNKICNMMDTRQIPVPRSLKYETTCQFYTRQFVTDFATLKTQPTASQQFIPVKGMTLVTCADLCGQEDTSCESFQFCPDTQECLIETSQQSTGFSSQTQSNCQYYKRSLSLSSPPSNQGSSQNIGVIAGTAVGTLVLGVIVGSVLVYIIQRHRQRKQYDFDMQSMVTN